MVLIVEQFSTAEAEQELEPIDLSTARIKCVGAQWLVRLVEHLSSNPDIIVNGFLAAGIPQSIDKGKPVLDDNDKASDTSDTDTINHSDSDSTSLELPERFTFSDSSDYYDCAC